MIAKRLTTEYIGDLERACMDAWRSFNSHPSNKERTVTNADLDYLWAHNDFIDKWSGVMSKGLLYACIDRMEEIANYGE